VDADGDDVNDYAEFRVGGDQTVADAGRVFHVRPTGSDTNDGLSWGNAWLTNAKVQSALSALPSGGFYYVLYESGQYYFDQLVLGGGSGFVNSRVVLVGSLYPDSSMNDKFLPLFGTSLFEMGGIGTGIIISEPTLEAVHMYGLRVTNGSATTVSVINGGAISTPDRSAQSGLSNLRIELSRFESNHASQFGGAVYIAPGWEAIIANSQFSGNDASDGGAIFLDCNFGVKTSSLNLADSTLGQNIAAGGGGAVRSQCGTVTIVGATFNQNKAGQPDAGCAGGAITTYDTDLIVSHSLLSQNSAVCTTPCMGCSEGGGAIYFQGTSGGTLTLVNSRLLSNQLVGDTTSSVGGALSVTDAQSSFIANNLFVGNVSAQPGGAIGLQGSQPNASHTLYLNTIAYNQGGPGSTGGLYIAENDSGASVLSHDNIYFFNENADNVAPTNQGFEDCQNTTATLFDRVSDSTGPSGSSGCGTAGGPDTSSPLFTSGFYLDPLSPAVNSGSVAPPPATAAADNICTLTGICSPDVPTTSIDGSLDTGVLDRGFHYTVSLDFVADHAVQAAFQSNDATGTGTPCSLSPFFEIQNTANAPLSTGHIVGVCLDSTTPAANFDLGGQGTLDPVTRGGAIPAGCSERPVLATDSGINSTYIVSVLSHVNGVQPLKLRFFVDDGAYYAPFSSFTFDLAGAQFGPGCI
jgi:hypothetical protein